MNTEQVTLYLSEENYSSKPKGFAVGSLQNSILQNKVTLGIEDFAHAVSKLGKATKLCNLPENSLNRKDTPIISQQVLMLDIDNESTEEAIFTLEDALQDTYIKNHAVFIYETFSSTVEKPKFRIVFKTDKPYTLNKEVEDAYDYLTKKYPQSDSKCRETTRLFFGSNKGYILIDWDNTLKIDKEKSFPKPSHGRKEAVKNIENHLSVKTSIPKNNLLVYNLLYNNEYTNVKYQLQNKNLNVYGGKFDTLEDFRLYLTTDDNVSMAEILDLPNSNPFRDIFHDETEPSAGLFRTENGVELYNCFSDSNNFTGDILKVVSKITQLSEFDSLLILKDALEITVDDDKKVQQVYKTKESALLFSQMIKDKTLGKKYPMLNKVLRNYDHIIYFMLKEFTTGHVYFNHRKGNYEIYTPLSISKINSKLANGSFGYNVNKDKLYTCLKLLTLLGVLNKKTNSEIPKWLLASLEDYKRGSTHKYRTEVYTICNLSRYKLSKMEDLCQTLIKEKVVVSKLDYDYIYNLFNKKLADNTFISNTSEDRDLSDKTQLIIYLALKVINNKLKKSSYITEKELIEGVHKNLRSNPSYCKLSHFDVKDNITKIRNYLCSNYGLKRLMLTKTNQEKYQITDVPKGKRPQVYMLDN